MRDFVQNQCETKEHDLWFRSQIQAALDHGIPHEVVMAETRAIIDRVAARKKKA